MTFAGNKTMNIMRTPIRIMTFSLVLICFQLSPSIAQVENGSSGVRQAQGLPQNISDMAIRQLATLIDERLSYMKGVAAYKWENKIPIEDPVREKVVLQKSLESAKLYQLDPEISGSFFELQITLAKEVQHYWFKEWERNGFDGQGYGDLEGFLRPALIDLGDAILRSLSRLVFQDLSENDWEKNRSGFIRIIDTAGIGRRGKLELFDATLAIAQPGSVGLKTTVAR